MIVMPEIDPTRAASEDLRREAKRKAIAEGRFAAPAPAVSPPAPAPEPSAEQE